MKSKLALLGAVAVVLSVMSWARPRTGPLGQPRAQGDEHSWTGVVSDDHCGLKHSDASEEGATCVKKCVTEMGGKYALVSEGKVYKIEPQEKFADFAGKAVKVTGTEKDGTITASAVEAAGEGESEQ